MDVSISLRAVQTMDGETDETRMQAVGTLEQTANGVQLTYTEAAADGGARVSVLLRGDHVMIRRQGEISSQLWLEPQRRRECRYETPYGSMRLYATGRSASFSFAEGKGCLTVAYALEMNGAVTEQAIEIRIKDVSLC